MTNDIIKAKAAQGQGDDHDKAQRREALIWDASDQRAFHTFVGLDTKRDEKVIKCTVHATGPDVPHWLNWSDHAITYTRQDHPPRFD